MKQRAGLRSLAFGRRGSAAAWLGLAWVLSNVPLAFGLLTIAAAGWIGGAAAGAVRLAGMLAIGIGLCAGERWAWAMGVCASLYYLVAAAAGCCVIGWAAATVSPTAPPWVPLVFGLNRGQCRLAVLAAVAGIVLALACLAILLPAREDYDVRFRRVYVTMLTYGVVPGALVVAIDAYLLGGSFLLGLLRF